MKFPKEFKYSQDHEWVDTTDNPTMVGISAYAVEQLGDIVHVDLPEVDKVFNQGDSFGTVESTKTVSDLYMPVSAKVVAVNKSIIDNPERLQEDTYHEGWLIKVELLESTEIETLMDSKSYKNYIESLDE